MNKENLLKMMASYIDKPILDASAEEGYCEPSLDKIEQKYLAEFGNITPREASKQRLYNWRAEWKYMNNLEKAKEITEDEYFNMLSEDELAKSYGNSNKLIRVETGTTRTRAELFLKGVGGWTLLERPQGGRDNVFDAWIGIQCSIISPDWGMIARAQYYAQRQKEKTIKLDDAVVLVFDIPEKYLYNENNSYEFSVSIADYDKIQNAQILQIDEYNEDTIRNSLM